MSPTSVTHYRAAWNIDHKTGSIALIMPDGHEELLEGLDTATWSALVDILRNERPLTWNPATRVLSTMSEIVGEGEMR